MRKFLNYFQHFLEVLIILVLILGGVSLFFAEPVSSAGPIARLLGSTIATYIYGVVFIVEALLLTFAKVFKKKNLHKHALLIIYLTMLFTIFLEWALIGWTWNIVDNIVISLVSGWCWLRWKFRTEYIDLEEFNALAEKYKLES